MPTRRARVQPGRADLRAVRRLRAGRPAPPTVTAKLLNRGGQPMADVPVQAAAGQPFQIDFPLAPARRPGNTAQIDAKAAVRIPRRR